MDKVRPPLHSPPNERRPTPAAALRAALAAMEAALPGRVELLLPAIVDARRALGETVEPQ